MGQGGNAMPDAYGGGYYDGEEDYQADDEGGSQHYDSFIEIAKRDADAIMRRARVDAQAIVDDAVEQARVDVERSKEEGYRDGYNEGFKSGVSESTAIKKKAEEIYDNTVAERERILNAVETDALDLMVGILNKLLIDTTHLRPEVLVTLIRKALSDITIIDAVRLRVSHSDYDFVMANVDAITEFVESTVKLDVVKDPKLDKFDCVIETEFGLIDCSLRREFEELKNNLYMICRNT
jgi:flagellar assembly protein FliH